MKWFSKQISPIDKVSEIFLDQFPAWSIQHATKLVNELKTSKSEMEKLWGELLYSNQLAETILIDCLTGAHVIYLSLNLPEDLLFLLGGEKKIATSISFWPKRSQQFFITASAFHKRILKEGSDSDITASIEKMFEADGKLEPLAVHIGTLTTKTIEDELNIDLGLFFVAGLYRIIFELQEEQLDWISNEVIGKAKKVS